MTQQRPNPKCERRTCLIISSILIIIIVIIILILGLTVFKPKHPIIEIQSTSIQGVSSHIALPFDVQLNFTLHLDILVENHNIVTFKHGTVKTLVDYRGNQVGDVDLPAGAFPAKAAMILPCRLTLQINKFVTDLGAIVQDIVDGKIVVQAKTRIPGKVRVFGIFDEHLVAISECKITIGFPSMKVQNQECKIGTEQ